MGLHLENLDQTTRNHMLAELDADVGSSGGLYMSPRLSPVGEAAYAGFLRDAIANGDDASFANALAGPGILNTHEQSHRNGTRPARRVPRNAAAVLAEGEFNRYYLRGLALRASVDGAQIKIYRARPSVSPRPESEALIDTVLDPGVLLDDLRQSVGTDTFFGLPPGVGSGLSGRLVPSGPDKPEEEATVSK